MTPYVSSASFHGADSSIEWTCHVIFTIFVAFNVLTIPMFSISFESSSQLRTPKPKDETLKP